jgi:hypothetical protein
LILLIGDSHIIRLRKTLAYDMPVKECYWGLDLDNYQKSRCDYEHLLQGAELPDKVYFSAHKGRHAWGSENIINTLYPCIKEVVKQDTTILPFFGYIDSKIQLVKYKNPKEAVIKYMNGFIKAFPNNKIRFIEPIPQFINNIGTGPDIYNFEDRYPMHKEFVYHLRKQCQEMGLEPPISPEKILGVDKFDESYECHECEYCLMPESIGIKWDHLKKEFNKKILDAIFAEML